MSKFATRGANIATPSVIEAVLPTVTHEGGPGFIRNAKGELFLRAVTSFMAEDTFYEKAGERDNRFVSLVQSVAAKDPAWMAQFVPWLRKEGFMRSAPVVIAAEYVAAKGPNARAIVASALQRADEPAEIIAYWMSKYGRNIPQPLKRGVADAVTRLYNERAVLKYDGKGQAWRFGDIIELVHPRPQGQWQSDLFKFCLDRRRHDAVINVETLAMIGQVMAFEAIPEDERTLESVPEGITWERLSGWIPGGMNAAAWEAVIPQMGYMALLRNLRNFDQAGISADVGGSVKKILSDPEQVARSMQFPFRFYSAWKQGISLHWAQTLEKALELSVQNIPEMSGRSLIVTDVSASMDWGVSKRGTLAHKEAAGLFGAALFAKNPDSMLVAAATTNAPVTWQGSVLRTVDTIRGLSLGGGTELGQAVRDYYHDGFDRVFILTDGQFWDQLPAIDVPYYLFNLNAYKSTPVKAGKGKDHELGGLSDATFKLIPLLEQRKAGRWPWE